MGVAVFSQHARADQILVEAPSAGYSFYGMHSTHSIAASFTLTGSSYVSTIDVVLRIPSITSFTIFDFSLQNSLTNPITTFASAALTVPLGSVSTEVINVNKTLPAGTYYLLGIVPGYAGTPVTPNDVDGWLLSTGIYKDAAGTVTDGVWGFNGSTWVLLSGDYFNNGTLYYAPAFSVNGSPAVPSQSAIDSSVNTHWYNWATTFDDYQSKIKNFRFVRDGAWWEDLEPTDFASDDAWSGARWSYQYDNLHIQNCDQYTSYQSGYDELVSKFQSSDSPELLMLLSLNNKNVNSDPNQITSAQYYDYVYHVVERYNVDSPAKMPGLVRSVKYFEIGNEIDNSQYSGGLTMANYVNNRLIPAYLAAKKANPNAVIMNGGLYLGGDTGFNTKSLNQMLSLIKKAKGAVKNKYYMNMLAIHYYCDPQDPEYFENNIQRATSVLTNYGIQAKPLWITEYGIATKNDPGGQIREEDQASVLLRFSVLMKAHKIDNSFIYILKDVNSSDSSKWENVYGLYKVACQGGAEITSEKESVSVLRTWAIKMNGLTFKNIVRSVRSNGKIYKVTFGNATRNMQMLWYTKYDGTGINPDHSGEQTTVKISIGNHIGVLSDMYGNIVNANLHNNAIISIGEQPQYIEY
jgi:hypothetical protein